MNTTDRTAFLFVLVATLAFGGISHAEGLIGLWQTDTDQMSPIGQTNTAGASNTIELRSDGSVTLTQVLKGMTGLDVSMPPQNGTYMIVDTNHITLELPASPLPSSPKNTDKFTYRLSGDELVLSTHHEMGPDVTLKYHRVKK